MRTILTFLILLTCAQSIAKKAKPFYKSQPLKQYYFYVYAAENCIINQDYKKAAYCYNLAFRFLKEPFAADLYNSLLVNINLKDNEKICEICKLLVLKGVDSGYFRKCIFNDFKKSADWQTLVLNYTKLKHNGEKTINRQISKDVEAFLGGDILAYQQCQKNLDRPDFRAWRNNLFETLKSMMLENDYFSEKKYGITSKDTEININNYFDFLMMQTTPIANKAALSVIKKAIVLGKIRAPFGLALLANSDSFAFSKSYYIFKDTLFKKTADIQKTNIKISNQINKQEEIVKAAYFLDSKENIKLKIKYIHKVLCRSYAGMEPNPFTDFQFQTFPEKIVFEGTRTEFESAHSVIIATCDN